MTRWHVQVVQLRARDVRRGDVVARDPRRLDGWFRVHEVASLPDGQVNVIDKGNVRSFTAGPYDLVGLQTPVELPAEADASARRSRAAAEPAPDGAPTSAHEPGDGHAPSDATAMPAAPAPPTEQAQAREAVAREMQSQAPKVRGSLPS